MQNLRPITVFEYKDLSFGVKIDKIALYSTFLFIRSSEQNWDFTIASKDLGTFKITYMPSGEYQLTVYTPYFNIDLPFKYKRHAEELRKCIMKVTVLKTTKRPSDPEVKKERDFYKEKFRILYQEYGGTFLWDSIQSKALDELIHKISMAYPNDKPIDKFEEWISNTMSLSRNKEFLWLKRSYTLVNLTKHFNTLNKAINEQTFTKDRATTASRYID